MDALKLAGVKNCRVHPGRRRMILPILQYGDPILRAKGERIEKIDERVRELAMNMIETMHEAHGVGLAAQQVGQPLRSLYSTFRPSRPAKRAQAQWQRCRSEERDADRADQPGTRGARRNRSGSRRLLSFPEITGDMNAHNRCLCARRRWKADVSIEASGLLARAIQHEHDHLHGILFIDRYELRAKAALSSRLKRCKRKRNAASASRRSRKRDDAVAKTSLFPQEFGWIDSKRSQGWNCDAAIPSSAMISTAPMTTTGSRGFA